MAVYRTVTVTATIATNTVTANGEVSEHIFTADADGQQVIVTDPYVAVETVEDGVLLTVRDAHEETQAVIYNGQKGDKGDKGNPGVDGFSPIATVTKSGDVATISITDKNGTTTATVKDGADGASDWDAITGKPTFATVATSGDYDDLANKPKMLTKVSASGGGGEISLTNSYSDGSFDSSVVELSGYVESASYSNGTLKLKRKNLLPDITAFTADGSPTSGSRQLVESGGVYEALAAKANTSHTHTKSQITDFPSLASVATSGSYNDLANKPTIPDALSAGDGIDIASNVISNTQGIEYIEGTQTAATNEWTGVSTDSALHTGKIIAYHLPYAGTSTAATLNLTMADGTKTGAIALRRQAASTVTTHFAAGNVLVLIYDGEFWKVSGYHYTDSNYVPTGYCTTGATTAAKSVTCTYGYRDDTTYFPCVFRYANTAANATLAIASYATTAAPIYVNGARTTSSNTFGRGVIMFLYHDGAYYCYNDGRFPILYKGSVTSIQDVLGNIESRLASLGA